MSAAGTEVAAPSSREYKKAVRAEMAGLAMENYDNDLYFVMAAVVAPLFFPSSNVFLSLAATYLGFAVISVFRPLGGLLWGSLADRFGRKRVMVMVIVTTATGTILVGVLPTYGQIGVLAPILLFMTRAITGLGMGGEFSNSASYMVEFAPENRKGLFGGFVPSGILTGSLLAVLAVFVFRASANR
jgi:MHS family proline/betaine transporter-like MFS transporter